MQEKDKSYYSSIWDIPMKLEIALRTTLDTIQL